MEALEQMLGNELVPGIEQVGFYGTIDRYAAGTAVLYSSGKPMGQPGLMSPQPFQHGYSMGNGLKIDFHGPNTNTLTHGHLKDQTTGQVLRNYNGYECSMMDPILNNNFKKFP